MFSTRRTLATVAAVAAVAVAAAPAAVLAKTSAPAMGGPVGTLVGAVRGERHPEIRRAISALQAARYDLQHAARDFGGHRADALAATDNAIRQLQIALQYDR